MTDSYRRRQTLLTPVVCAIALLLNGCGAPQLSADVSVTPAEQQTAALVTVPTSAPPTSTHAPTLAPTDTPAPTTPPATSTSVPSIVPTSFPATAAPQPTLAPTGAPPNQESAPTPIPPPPDQKDPVTLLTAYYDAIHDQDYQRASSYWENGSNSPSPDLLTQEYAEALTVTVVIRPPDFIGSDGNNHASIPTLLIISKRDGSTAFSAICHRMNQVKPFNVVPPTDKGWYLSREEPLQANGPDLTVLEQSCSPSGSDLSRRYENQDEPVSLLSSYYNAINLKDYERAYSYYRGAPRGGATLDEFRQRFTDTISDVLFVRLPVRYNTSAGGARVAIAAMVITTQTDNSEHIFVGCYEARFEDPRKFEPPRDYAWHLVSEDMALVAENGRDATLLMDACR